MVKLASKLKLRWEIGYHPFFGASQNLYGLKRAKEFYVAVNSDFQLMGFIILNTHSIISRGNSKETSLRLFHRRQTFLR